MKSTKIFAHFLVIALVLVGLAVGERALAVDSINVEKAIYNKLKEGNKLGKIYHDQFGKDMPSGTTASVTKIKSPLHGVTNYEKTEYPIKPLLVVDGNATNCLDNKATETLSLAKTTEISSTWFVDKTLSVGAEATVSGQVPFGAEVDVTVTTDFSVTKGSSKTETKKLEWKESQEIDIDPNTRVLTRFIVEGKDETDIPFWVDFNVKKQVEMKFTTPDGKIKFYSKNNGHGDRLGRYSDNKKKDMNLKNGYMKNDEIRSVKLHGVNAGTIIKVYDNPDAHHDDDWTEITVKKWKEDITIRTFEKSYENDYIKVKFHHDNGLDGKISHVKIKPGDKHITITINIEDYLSEEDRKIRITGVWTGCASISGNWFFSKDPDFKQSDCQTGEGFTAKTTGTHIRPEHVKRFHGEMIMHRKVRPR